MKAPILFVTTRLTVGGAEQSLYQILTQLDRDRWEPLVVVLTGMGRIAEAIAALGISIFCLEMRRSLPNFTALWRLKRIIEAHQPSLIQGWMYHGNAAALGAASMSSWRGPVVWSIRHCVHDLSYERWLTRWLIRSGAWFSRRPFAIVYNARASLRQHRALGYSNRRSLLIPNGLRNFAPNQSSGIGWSMYGGDVLPFGVSRNLLKKNSYCRSNSPSNAVLCSSSRSSSMTADSI